MEAESIVQPSLNDAHSGKDGDVVTPENELPPAKRIRLDDFDSDDEDDEDDHTCVICLQSITDRTVLPCAHDSFCFECMVMWTNQSRKCPLCASNIGQYLIHRIRSEIDYQKHYLAPLRSSPVPMPPVRGRLLSVGNARRRRRVNAQWGSINGQGGLETPESSRDALDRAIEKRRWIYRHKLYAKHIATNSHTRFRPYPTPLQFASSEDLISRATAFVRRELRVWVNLDVEFLTTFIISLLKSMDVRSEPAVRALAEFLDLGGRAYVEGAPKSKAEHFAHELYTFLRSPYRELNVYDSVIQYDIPPGVQPYARPSNNRWRPRSPVAPSRYEPDSPVEGESFRASQGDPHGDRKVSRSPSWGSPRDVRSSRSSSHSSIGRQLRSDTRAYSPGSGRSPQPQLQQRHASPSRSERRKLRSSTANSHAAEDRPLVTRASGRDRDIYHPRRQQPQRRDNHTRRGSNYERRDQTSPPDHSFQPYENGISVKIRNTNDGHHNDTVGVPSTPDPVNYRDRLLDDSEVSQLPPPPGMLSIRNAAARLKMRNTKQELSHDPPRIEPGGNDEVATGAGADPISFPILAQLNVDSTSNQPEGGSSNHASDLQDEARTSLREDNDKHLHDDSAPAAVGSSNFFRQRLLARLANERQNGNPILPNKITNNESSTAGTPVARSPSTEPVSHTLSPETDERRQATGFDATLSENGNSRTELKRRLQRARLEAALTREKSRAVRNDAPSSTDTIGGDNREAGGDSGLDDVNMPRGKSQAHVQGQSLDMDNERVHDDLSVEEATLRTRLMDRRRNNHVSS